MRILSIVTYLIALMGISISCSGAAGFERTVEVEKFVTPQLAMPVVSTPAGTYTADVSLTLTTPVGGATIYYTTDGSNPTQASAQYSTAIPIAGHGTSVTVKAFAELNGFLPSQVFVGTYTIQYGTVANVVASPGAGSYSSDQNISLSTATAGAAIYYTTNGVDPTTASTLYTGPIALAGHGSSINLKARAFKSGMLEGSIASGTFTINYAAVSTPNISVNYSVNSATVSITSTAGATIRYTTDGSTPTASTGTIYSGSFSITQNTTIRAIAYQSGLLNSTVATTDGQFAVVAPTISPDSQTSYSPIQITMATTTSGAQIRYTTDGSTPTDTVGTVYAGAFSLNNTATVRAVAYKGGWTTSATTINNYTIQLADPFFLTAPGTYCRPQQVGFHTISGGATIRYTTDGSTPSSTVGTIYSTPFTVSANTSVKAVAYKAGFPDSAVISGNYVFTGCFFTAGTDLAMYRSVNGGQSWDISTLFGEQWQAALADARGNVVVTSSNRMFTSSDGGRNWVYRGNGRYIRSLAVSPSGTWVGVTSLCGYGAIWTSTDGAAASWSSSVPLSGYYPVSVTYLAGHGFLMLAYDCSSPNSAVILHSANGTTWTSSPLPDFKNRVMVAGNNVYQYGYGLLVSGNDGYNWSPVTIPTTQILHDMKYAGGRFVAVGQSGTAIYSDDGTNWSAANSGTSANLIGLAYLNGKWAAITQNAFVYTSSDGGATWTPSTPPTLVLSVTGLTTAYDRFLAVGSNSLIMSSVDGNTWDLTDYAPINVNVYGMTMANARRLVLAAAGSIFYSDNYRAFYPASSPSVTLNAVTWAGGNNLAAVGQSAQSLISTNNGLTWTSDGVSVGSSKSGIASDGTKYIQTAWSNSIYASAITPISWTTSFLPGSSQWEDIEFANNQYVAVGHYGVIGYSNDFGSTWSAATVTGINAGDRFTGVAYGLGKWVAVGYSGRVYYSANASSWSFGSIGASPYFEELAFGGGRFVGVGQNGYIGYSSDGINWQSSSAGSSNLYSVAYIPAP